MPTLCFAQVANTYLLSTGLPLDDDEHVDVMCAFAADLLAMCLNVPGVGHVRVRIGLACGPTTAGVIGQSRRFYRVFGDTGACPSCSSCLPLTADDAALSLPSAVNMASRMMSTGQEGRVHVSAAIAAVLQAPRDPAIEPTMPHLEVMHRGKIPVKGKGDVDTYWLVHPTLGVADLVPAMSEVAGLVTGATALTMPMLTELPPPASQTSDVSTTSHHTPSVSLLKY